jgi:hypothetical protein
MKGNYRTQPSLNSIARCRIGPACSAIFPQRQRAPTSGRSDSDDVISAQTVLELRPTACTVPAAMSQPHRQVSDSAKSSRDAAAMLVRCTPPDRAPDSEVAAPMSPTCTTCAAHAAAALSSGRSEGRYFPLPYLTLHRSCPVLLLHATSLLEAIAGPSHHRQ